LIPSPSFGHPIDEDNSYGHFMLDSATVQTVNNSVDALVEVFGD
jgi:hypothetical protein